VSGQSERNDLPPTDCPPNTPSERPPNSTASHPSVRIDAAPHLNPRAAKIVIIPRKGPGRKFPMPPPKSKRMSRFLEKKGLTLSIPNPHPHPGYLWTPSRRRFSLACPQHPAAHRRRRVRPGGLASLVPRRLSPLSLRLSPTLPTPNPALLRRRLSSWSDSPRCAKPRSRTWMPP
jgi:hypothetical protein